MGDAIPVRRIARQTSEPRSAPPVPRNLMSEFKTAPGTQSDLPTRPPLRLANFQSPRAASDPPPPPPRAATQLEPPIVAPDAPARAEVPAEQTKPAGKGNVFKRYWRHKLWTLPLTVLIIVAGFMAVPTTRYLALAYFVSRPFTITVTDSMTNLPIGGARVKLDGHSAQTDSSGKATITVPVGDRTLTISKMYYKSSSQSVFVDLAASANSLTLHLEATGRQVPIKVINKITGKPIPEAEFTIGETTARSDLNGQTTVVLPANNPSIPVVIKADGYTTLTSEVQVTTKADPANTFTMVPVGRIYFLSDASGTTDVVSTNLDGSGRKIVLAGSDVSGQDTPFLIASHDWKYLALFTSNSGGNSPKLSLIDTSNDRVTTIDTTAATYLLEGWNGHNFIYMLDRSATLSSWQPNQQSIMTYNADTKQAKVIVNSKATGTSDADAEFQKVGNVKLFGSNVIYTLTWMKPPDVTSVSGQVDAMISAKPDGSGSRTLKSVDAATARIDSLKVASPTKLYFAVVGATSNYYRLDANGNITQSSTITSDSVNQNYPQYDASPSGVSAAWTQATKVFVGDASGSNGSTITLPAGFVLNDSPYDWFSDGYLLVRDSTSASLYIVSATGGKPLKISDNVTL